MLINFVFDENITPWETVEMTVGECVKRVSLKAAQGNVRILEVPDSGETIYFKNKNVWKENGTVEIISSIDGVFNSVFRADRLPCSIEIEVECDGNDKTIDVFYDSTVLTTLKSQQTWQKGYNLQCTILIIMIAFLSILFSVIFKSVWYISFIIGCLLIFTTVRLGIKRADDVLDKINKVASMDLEK